MRSLLMILGLLALGACANLLDVERPERVPLSFEARIVQPGPDPVPAPDARGEQGRIEVEGSIGTPVPCYRVEGSATRDGSDLTLRVSATAMDVVCATVVATFGYEAAITGLEAGDYRVRIIHSWPGRSINDQRVLDRVVTVR
jgi:hypothetical protein